GDEPIYVSCTRTALFIIFHVLQTDEKEKEPTHLPKKQVTASVPVFLFMIVHIFFFDSLLKCVCNFTIAMS
ncbi:hypothetical protein, partial [Bacillus sp. mrc49]|uniref:hypothetical protein n=1 Tax=Bacillus sp. mrc49 TaxID=2054913 RepID=UPI001E5851F3